MWFLCLFLHIRYVESGSYRNLRDSFCQHFHGKHRNKNTEPKQNKTKPTVWKRFIDDGTSLWDIDKQEIDLFLEQANSSHPTIKFTAEISDKEITFLDTVVYKGERFQKDAIPVTETHYKPTETFQYTHYTSCHPPGVKRGFIKGESIRLLGTNSSGKNSQESLSNFKTRLLARGYRKNVERILSEDSFAGRESAFETKEKDSRANITICHSISPGS